MSRGTHSFICDATGFKLCSDQKVRQWDEAIVGREFVDKRNPQDFVRARADRQAIRDARPEPEDTFLAPGDVTAASL